MNLDLLAAAVTLPADGTRRVFARPGDRIECVAGALWVTQDGDPRDVVLGAGDAFDVDRAGPLLMTALGGPDRRPARYLRLDPRAVTAAVA
jgi:hypothetical protein